MLRKYILKVTLCGLLLVGLAACSESPIETLSNGAFNGKPQIVLTFVTPNDNASTRADGMGTRSADGDPDGYEAGLEWENYINIAEGDYKIYFFTYSANDTKGGTLIAEFEPTEITSASTGGTTTYTMTGEVPEELMSVSDFRVVMLANWGEYLEDVEEGVTTIDDLCEANSTTSTVSTYAAMVGSDGVATMTSAENLIPFFGVQEYTGVSFGAGTAVNLSTPVSLLRAVAKVEIIVTADSYVHELNTASIVNYNSTGYCAPWQVYVADDYDTSASKNPSTNQWGEEWVDGLHLVSKDASGNGINDTDNGNPNSPKTILMYKVQDYMDTDPDTGEPLDTPQLETWRAYVPEYNNMSTDYSYMTVSCNSVDEELDADYTIYFADYTDGVTTAYGESEDPTTMLDRLNIKRNNLYRFYVTVSPFTFRVTINILPWVERWDDYEF